MITFAPVESFNRMHGIIQGFGGESEIGSVETPLGGMQHFLTFKSNKAEARVAAMLYGEEMRTGFCHVIVWGDHLNVASHLRAVAELLEGQAR